MYHVKEAFYTLQGEGGQVQDTAGCRPGCGACCIAPSITSSIPGMPNGKPAGVRCVQLDETNLCKLFGDSSRPAVCAQFDYDTELCGSHRDQALTLITELERATEAQ